MISQDGPVRLGIQGEQEHMVPGLWHLRASASRQGWSPAAALAASRASCSRLCCRPPASHSPQPPGHCPGFQELPEEACSGVVVVVGVRVQERGSAKTSREQAHCCGSLLSGGLWLTCSLALLCLSLCPCPAADEMLDFKYSPGKLRGNQYKSMMTKEELEEEQR